VGIGSVQEGEAGGQADFSLHRLFEWSLVRREEKHKGNFVVQLPDPTESGYRLTMFHHGRAFSILAAAPAGEIEHER
jgi:hypothetical protein